MALENLQSCLFVLLTGPRAPEAAGLAVATAAAHRSGEMDGYSYWLLADYWTGSNGILDPFYGDMGSTAGSFRRFNAPTLLLLDRDRVSFRGGAAASFPIHASRFEAPPSSSARLRWSLRAPAGEAARGGIPDALLAPDEIPGFAVGEGLTRLGEVHLRFAELKPQERPRRLSLTVSLEDAAGPAVNF